MEVGPAFPPEGDYLKDDFEGESLRNWILAGTGEGKGREDDPRISTECVHGGKSAVRLTGMGGGIERAYAEPLTDCVVTVWC